MARFDLLCNELRICHARPYKVDHATSLRLRQCIGTQVQHPARGLSLWRYSSSLRPRCERTLHDAVLPDERRLNKQTQYAADFGVQHQNFLATHLHNALTLG